MTEIDLEAENKAIAKEYKELLRIIFRKGLVTDTEQLPDPFGRW